MHIVATNPKYLNRQQVPAEDLETEKGYIKEHLTNTGKKLDPKNIDKITNAKLNKWYEENVLSEQNFVIVDHDEDDSNPSKIEELVRFKGEGMGKELKLKEFRIFI